MKKNNKDLYVCLNKSSSSIELFLLLDDLKKDLFVEENFSFFNECFKRFPNLLINAPNKFKHNKLFIKSAVKVTASNILFTDKIWNFEEFKEFVEINPFVSIYSIDFVSSHEQDLLYLESLKKTGNSRFFYDIENDDLKENILLDIYFNKFDAKHEISELIIEESNKFIKTFEKEELENIKSMKYV